MLRSLKWVSALGISFLTGCASLLGERVPAGSYALVIHGSDTTVHYEGERVRGLRASSLVQAPLEGETHVATYAAVWRVYCYVSKSRPLYGHAADPLVRRYPHGVTDAMLEKHFEPYRAKLQEKASTLDLAELVRAFEEEMKRDGPPGFKQCSYNRVLAS